MAPTFFRIAVRGKGWWRFGLKNLGSDQTLAVRQGFPGRIGGVAG